jgi:hypothetical protein
MTTPGFGAISSAVARAMSEVRSQHCKPPTYRPAETQRGSIGCTACRGLLTFTASAVDGRTTGRCSSANCIKLTD